MKTTIQTILIFIVSSFFGCKQEKPVSCNELNFTISVSKTDVTQNPANGTITATASGGEGFIYSIGTISNATGKFDNLTAGTYTVEVKNSIGCLISKLVTIETNIPGITCTENNIIINTSATPSTPCVAGNGTISITASGSSGFTYKLNNGAFQNSNVYNNLNTGSYTITVKDVNGCLKTKQVSITTAPPGPNFSNVKNIIKSKCGGCHINGGNSGGVNYDNDCSIVTGWNKINQECVINSSMPPGNPLSSNLKAQITAWVNAGHRYSD